MGKKKKGPVIKKGLDEWMATYSDMVTLLFCFFVLLYASSSQDKTKFQYIFQAFSTGGEFINTVVAAKPEKLKENSGEGNSEVPPVSQGEGSGSITQMGAGKQEDTFEELFNMVSKVIDSSSLSEAVDVSAGGGKIRISFDSGLLFEPDSAELKPQGKEAIQLIMPSLKVLSPYIGKVEIDGHTSGDGTAGIVNDWDLSADRAKNVLKFMDLQQDVESSKYQMSAFGPYKPIADNNTTDGKQKNRRVEVIVSRNTHKPDSTPYLMDIMRFDYNQQIISVNEDKNPVDKNIPNEEAAASEIVRRLKEKYEDIKTETNDLEYIHAGHPATLGGADIPDEAYYETDAAGKPVIPTETTVPETEASPEESSEPKNETTKKSV